MKRFQFVLLVRDMEDGEIEYKYISFHTVEKMADQRYWTEYVEKLIGQVDETRDEIVEVEL